jgi:Protein of unknown function (DUF664)
MTENTVLHWPPVAGNEVDTLLGELERARRLIAWKCGGLSADGLRATVGVSSMTLGGLLKHLALVEWDWFGWKLLGQAPPPPWDAVDLEGDPGFEWRTAADNSPEYLMSLWRESVARSRENVAKALAAGGLDQPAAFTWPDGKTPSLRTMIIDMIEEYARHAGHADLIRESVDGLTGEDAPRDLVID